ncbi:MAG: SDR family NAD(P)-dependent oxidoreductase [Alphaproteobacteria bacterium]|nr:SDR family NAD(P)-dependent oxidoreductase [Alphaproteobacteria bacterium]
MSQPLLLVFLPPAAAALADEVRRAGGQPVLDLLAGAPPAALPEGAWVRVAPGMSAPGEGPVLLAGEGAPVSGRPTWLERTTAGPAPEGIAGIVLRGREAGGLGAEVDGLALLEAQGGGVILDAGLGPDTAAAAAALGAIGAVLSEQLWALDSFGERLNALARGVRDTDTHRVGGLRFVGSPLSPAARRLAGGEDPMVVTRGWADPSRDVLVPAGQGLALAEPLAARCGDLAGVIRAFRAAIQQGPARVQAVERWPDTAAPRAATLAALRSGNGRALAAEAGGAVGSGVLWQEAAWANAPIAGEPLKAAAAVGVPVVAPEQALAALRGPAPAASSGSPAHRDHSKEDPHESVVIVGMGCVLPGAPDLAAFWESILQGRDSIREVPVDRWDPALFFDADPDTPDKTYSRIGGFITDFVFNSKQFRIPPKVAQALDPVQKMTLSAVAAALEDAGITQDSPVDRSRIAVILGNSMGGSMRDDYALRSYYPAVAKALTEVPAFQALPEPARSELLQSFERTLKADLLPITEDSMPGELSNVIAGRVANAFDLGGPNFTTDAACASSMAALQSAVKGLLDGDYDVALTGGADRSMDVPTYVKFSKIGALSADHSAPFDASANGFVMGEGAGILVLKRLSDARRDGDRIYAIIEGIGASSDGKGKGITAPNINGQKRALRRAYAEAGVDPVEVDLIECHGTSTVVGDKVEVEALTDVMGAGRRGDRGPVRIGSVKSQIGHLKSAAGAAAIIKSALALHHRTLPPSINFREAREDVDFTTVPLQVQTRAEPWHAEGWTRRAGVSAFGFGGTNFHVVLAEAPQVDAEPAPPPRVEVVERPLPQGMWAISAPNITRLVERISALERGEEPPWQPSRPLRLTAAADTVEERRDQLDRARQAIAKGRGYDLLRMRGIHLEDTPCDGKLAFMFTGQGSQYLGMGLDLAERFPVVRATFDEADAVMADELDRSLRDYIAGQVHDTEEASNEALRDTKISQPATLTVDIALLRLMGSFGIVPDMVAGHSLGEYGALVAAGVMDFGNALRAVSARGREMAGVRIPDPGRMASIAAPLHVIQEILSEIPGYVVPANKNAPNQTVIAGESNAVEAACEAFRSRKITVFPLPVSHAFHTRIVAPASKPLREVLIRLGVHAPRRPITCNVTSNWYPTDTTEILDLLARQVAAPVEWVAQMERMYEAGARIFVECGPKRALSGFAVSIFKRRPHRSLYTNHPKVGGDRSLRDALAGLLALGFPVRSTPDAVAPDLFAEPGPRLATSAALARDDRELTPTPFVTERILALISARTGLPPDGIDPEMEFEADLGIDTVRQAELIAEAREVFGLKREAGFLLSDHRSVHALTEYFAGRLGQLEPAWDRSEPAVAIQPRRPLPTPPPAPAAHAGPSVLPDDALSGFLLKAATAGLDGVDAEGFARAMLPAVQALLAASWAAFQSNASAAPAAAAPAPTPVPSAPLQAAPLKPAPARTDVGPAVAADATTDVTIVCTGASLGLPGGEGVFTDDNVLSILRGENRISVIPPEVRSRFLNKDIVRLVKDEAGQGTFLPVSEDEQVIHLAGRPGRFDLAEDYGVPPSWVQALDRATCLAFGAGLEALRDAGVPLVRTWRDTSTGKRVPTGWALPEAWRDDTGVVFASAFPGYNAFADLLLGNGADDEGHFDRRFLFRILSMGHSQFAQFIGARGPNTQVNAACSSTTQATALAEDWIRLGRARRVIVVGADDVTDDSLLEWLGSGFMAAGAATTAHRVEDGALPFDRRRHGMIMGMGAVGLLLERAEDAQARGCVPIAELLATQIANSAFHGTRLDADHIAEQFTALVQSASKRAGVPPAELARRSVFMSHETYTPARGGSAGAEIAALRAAFGPAAAQVVVANTKGFTGHTMGAGIEDTVALKALQYQQVPPIPNLKEPDPDLGDLRLSQGGHYDVQYALRLSAGFGSQVGLAAWKKVADGDRRVADEGLRAAWLREVTGIDAPELVVEQRTLRAIEPEQNEAPAPAPAATLAAAPAAKAVERDAVIGKLLSVIGEKTGYGQEDLDLDYELEADLGIDTVKQAEVFSEVRDHYGVERDDSFSLADYPTIRALSDWLIGQLGGAATPQPAPPQPFAMTAPVEAAPALSPVPQPGVQREAVLDTLLAVIGEKTGYERADLDLDYELEADLGIDTVKQAEVFSEVRDHYGVERDDSFSLADYPTIRALSDWLFDRIVAEADTLVPAVEPVLDDPTDAPDPWVTSAPKPTPPVRPGDVLEYIETVICETTGYMPEDLEVDYELEADLGIDTVKQAEIFSKVREHFGVERDDSMTLADYPTIRALSDWLIGRLEAAQAPEASAEASAEAFAEASAEVFAEAPLGPSTPAEDVSEPLSEPISDPGSELPSSFWIRRPVLVPRPLGVEGRLHGRSVRLLGDGPVAEALERELIRLGATLSEVDVDAVIDVAADVLEVFEVAKAHAHAPPRDWICLTRTGEAEEMTPDQAFFEGSRAGFTKALGREWSGCHARLVDVTPSRDPDSIAALICAELATPDGTVEIFYDADGVRKVVELAVEAHPPAMAPPRADQVVLVTGGGRGVTAAVAREFARRVPCTLVLVGRSPMGAAPLDENAEKARIRDALAAEGVRPTPVNIERRLAPLRRAEEIRLNVEEMRDLGARVEYRTVDMAGILHVRELIDAVAADHGHIDGCIHGAGVEESRLIQDKDTRAFRRVFDGKALGGLTLAERLPADAWLLSMGSVAGRFGNAGQVDYSAANEALAQICRSRPRSLHVDWTAWADVGMAVRGGMQNLLESRGVELMPAAAGAALAVDLIAAEVTGEVVVAGRLGTLVPSPNHPLLDNVELEGDVVVARYTLDVDRDPWILDHAIDQVPVLPGVIGVELMAAAATLARPGQRFVGAEDVHFERPVKLYHNKPVELEMRAVPVGEGRVRCSLFTERRAKTGRRLRTAHFRATILLGQPPEVEPLPPAFFPDDPINRMAIYRRFFHGPAFQVLRGADAVTRDGVLASGRVEHAFIAEGLLTSPLALEAAFQAAGLHAMVIDGKMALPASLERLWLSRPVRDGEALTLTARRREGLYDVDIDGEDGRLLSLRGFALVERGPLPERDRFPEPEAGWADEVFAPPPIIEELGDPSPIARGEARAGEPADGVLSEAELAELSARGTAKRVGDRVAGRIAAKRAVSALTGRPFSAIRVRTLESGQPVVEVDGRPGPHVSISHAMGRAVAVATVGRRVGVDLEEVRARHPAFAQDWFNDAERALLGGDPLALTIAWSAKEAVLKALGVGMAQSPLDIEVCAIVDDRVEVRLRGALAATFGASGPDAIDIGVTIREGGVLVEALLAA